MRAHDVRLRWRPSEPADRLMLQRWYALLDADEHARAQRFRFAADRRAFIAAHALLRSMLSDATGLPTSAWRFVTGSRGRPELAPPLARFGLRFNISHTRGWVACAIARVPVGVDVEAEDREASAELLPEREARLVAACPPEQMRHTFTRIWTLKEAFIKATGEGMYRPLDSFSFTLDPVRIAFHAERYPDARDDPDAWQFVELAPAPHRRLALAIRRATSLAPAIDARPDDLASS